MNATLAALNMIFKIRLTCRQCSILWGLRSHIL